jgi:[ribosomal protein S18]-alanine N-acetyltransferase
MSKNDIPQVSAIDREAFPTMWPPVNFNHELTNRLAHYIVACDGNKIMAEPDPAPVIKLVPVRTFLGLRLPFTSKAKSEARAPVNVEYIVGFVGMWIMVDEAHIINIAVRASHRGKGVGELLLISSIEMAEKLRARVATLEVRITNKVAQNLYTKYGFRQAGIRKGYYTDNKEDALIMTTDVITSAAYTRQFQKLKSDHFQKLGHIDYQVSG